MSSVPRVRTRPRVNFVDGVLSYTLDDDSQEGEVTADDVRSSDLRATLRYPA